MKINLAIIGLGTMGKILLKILLNNFKDKANVNAICDIRNEALNEARKLGIEKTYNDIDEMLENESLDAIIIATPPHLHKIHAIKALKNNLYVLLEKPMATNLKDALEIYKHANNRLMIAFSLRFHELYDKIKNMINDFLGDVIFQWHIALGRIPPVSWITRKEFSGGMLNEHAVHVFYIYRWYAGEIREVYAKTWTLRDNIDIEDNAIVTLNHKNGASSILSISWSGYHRWRKWGLQTMNGRVTVDGYLTGKYVISTLNKVVEENEFNKPAEHIYVNELKYFIECIENSWKPEPNEVDGIKIQEIIEAIHISANENKIVKFPII